MKNKILSLLQNVHHLQRTKIIKKHKEIITWVQDEYSGVELNIVLDSIIKNYNPYCTVCNNPIKNLGKITCSVACRSKYNALFKDSIVEKRKNTLITKYGVDNPGKLDLVQEKRLNTMLKKYGSKVSEKSLKLIKERSNNLNKKGRTTILEKYGVSNPGQIVGHTEKCKSTMLEKYGVDNYFKSEEFKLIQKEKNLNKWQLIFPATVDIISINDNLLKQDLFENPNKEIDFICKICNKQDKIPSETAKWRIQKTGTPCIACSGINLGSEKQNQLKKYIQSLSVECLENYRLENNKQIDIFCPEYKLGFEFNGLFWHNDTRLDKNYHVNKTNTAQTQNIRLIHIFEDEWDHKQDIVKSRIKNLLKKNSTKISARKCQIKQVSSSDEQKFLENNHIQGYARSSIAFGLYYEDELISLMSFSKPNKSKGQTYVKDHWELLRFSSKLNLNIPGGADRLLKHFIKNLNPKQILSFADRRWSLGDLYTKLGFESKGNTAINYWYINLKEGKRIHRYNLRKNKDDDQNLTEFQNRLNQGYLRVWDCGSSKWVWSK